MPATVTHLPPPPDYRERIGRLVTALAPDGLWEDECDLTAEINPNPGRYVPSLAELKEWQPCLPS